MDGWLGDYEYEGIGVGGICECLVIFCLYEFLPLMYELRASLSSCERTVGTRT